VTCKPIPVVNSVAPEVAAQVSPETHKELEGVIGAYIPQKKDDTADSKKILLAESQFNITEDKAGQLKVTGTINNEETRQKIIAAVKAAQPKDKKVKIIDELKVKKNTIISANVPQLTDLITNHINTAEQATLSYSAKAIRLGGIIDERKDGTAIVNLAKPISTNDRPLDNKLQLLPRELLDLRVERNGGDITVNGTLPSQDTRNEILSLVKENANGKKVIDKTTISKRPTKERWWKNHPKQFIPGLLNDTTGPAFVHYHPDNFETNGLFPKEADHSKLSKVVDQIPAKIGRQTKLTFIPPVAEVVAQAEPAPEPTPEPEPAKPAPAEEVAEAPAPKEPTVADDLAKNLKLLPVYFNTSSSYVQRKEEDKIKKAAETILASKAKDLGLTVGGYADQRGNPVNNKALSLERANSVRRKLIKLGVKSSRLTVNHFGEDTSEMNPDDLWKARRVEISITPIKK